MYRRPCRTRPARRHHNHVALRLSTHGSGRSDRGTVPTRSSGSSNTTHADRPEVCQMSWPTISVRSLRATSTRSWRHSNRMATPASLRAAGTSTEVATACARSRSCCLERRRHLAAALPRGQRRTLVHAGVQRGALGQEGAAAGGRGHCLLRGQSGRLAAARIYDDADPPLRPRM